MEREPSYHELYDDALYALLSIHRKNLGILEQQAALFTFIHVPSHILLSIEEQKRAITAIKVEFDARRQDIQQDCVNVIEANEQTHQYTVSKQSGDTLDAPPEQAVRVQEVIEQLNANSQTLGEMNRARAITTWGIIGFVVIVLTMIIIRLIPISLGIDPLESPLLNVFFAIAGIVCFILVMSGAFQFLTAGAKP